MITNMDDLRTYLKHNELLSNDILSIMTILRIQIEADNKKDNYRWLNLFANWCVHSKISKSNVTIDIFRNFYDALGNFDFTQGQSIKGFYDYIFDKLQRDMRNMFREYAIPARLVNNERVFCGFLIGILLIIKDRPIHLPENLSKIQEDEVSQLPKLLKFANNRDDIDLTPMSISIKHTDKGTFDFALATKGIQFISSTIQYKNKSLSFLATP